MYLADNQGMLHVLTLETDSRRLLQKPFAHSAAVFGRVPGRTFEEYGVTESVGMGQGMRIAKRFTDMVRRQETAELVYLTTLAFKPKDSYFKTPMLVRAAVGCCAGH